MIARRWTIGLSLSSMVLGVGLFLGRGGIDTLRDWPDPERRYQAYRDWEMREAKRGRLQGLRWRLTPRDFEKQVQREVLVLVIIPSTFFVVGILGLVVGLMLPRQRRTPVIPTAH